MHQTSKTASLLLEIADRCFLFMSEGRSGPYAASLGSEEYEAMLRAVKKKNERKRKLEALQRLKQQKLIRMQKRGDDFIIAFTKEGEIAVLKQRIIEKKDILPHGKFCLVSFDVPEDLRYIRLMIRKLLKKAKFKQAHKSVWVTRHDVVQEFCRLIDLLYAKNWMRVYEAIEKSNAAN